ncbi:class I lanthipeptide [Ascidiimonas aurantiaca]|uniref:class I lanthipeptide n=1 Tax=Ascidiimonas aurantiaca TaxID=1685432 RepID=UPI003BB4A39C
MKKKSNLNLMLNKRKVSELSTQQQVKIQGGYNTVWNFTCNSFYCSGVHCF